MIAAAASGSGKTTVTCGILQAFLQRGLQPASFKCGPDYIDPLFHSAILQRSTRNLDLFFFSAAMARRLLWQNAQKADLAVIEGVMGYYDGMAMSTEASSFALAKATKTPVILVMNGRGRALTLAAEIRGLQNFRKDSGIRGVILNHTAPRQYAALRNSIMAETGLPVLGHLPEMPQCYLASRHLGLVTASEVVDLKDKMKLLAQQAEATLDLDQLLELAQTAPKLTSQPIKLPPAIKGKLRIAVARDQAFCFYYEDSLELLRRLGAELVEFSPLEDQALPPNCQGLMLGGGYPELYAQKLSDNQSMRQAVATAVAQGLPCVAECGGFLYLHAYLEDVNGSLYPMTGNIPATARRTKQLQRFGYVRLKARKDSLLCKRGDQIAAHEFHYWYSDGTEVKFKDEPGFTAQKPLRTEAWACGVSNASLYAGFPHLHFYANPKFALNFLNACRSYSLQGAESYCEEVDHD
jgi:cobyrinic acid a,c-diamide synthase